MRPRGSERGRFWVSIGSIIVTSAVGCGTNSPFVESWTENGWKPLAYAVESVEATRDGYVARSTAVLSGENGERLVITLHVSVNPRAMLERGEWSYEGPDGRANGRVEPLSVDFLGGQGGGAAIGGRFLLNENSRPRFRVKIPPRASGTSAR